MNFHAGQKVECIDDRYSAGCLLCGAVYTVAGFGLTPAGNPGLFLEGAAQARHNHLCGPLPFYARRFRPIVETKTDISIFTKMLTPKRERAPA